MDRGPHRPGTAGENPCHPRVAGGFAARTGGHPNRSAVVGVPQEEPPPGTPHVRAGAQRRVSRRARPVNIPAEVPANGTHSERWSWRHGSDAVAIRFRASLAARNAPLRMGIRAAILRSSADPVLCYAPAGGAMTRPASVRPLMGSLQGARIRAAPLAPQCPAGPSPSPSRWPWRQASQTGAKMPCAVGWPVPVPR